MSVLTQAQRATLAAVANGAVSTTTSYNVLGARADVLGRLEERGLLYVDWDAEPVNRTRMEWLKRYPVRLTDAGEAANL